MLMITIIICLPFSLAVNVAIIILGQTRVLPFDFQTDSLMENVLGPFKNNPIFEPRVFLYLSLKGQAVNKTTGGRIDLPLAALDRTIKILEPVSLLFHNDETDPEIFLYGGTDFLMYSCQSQCVKRQAVSAVIIGYEELHGFQFDQILFLRPDGLFDAPLITKESIPALDIMGRVYNPTCGYGAMDHFFYGGRTAALKFLSMISGYTSADTKLAQADPKCQPHAACFGCECMQMNWMSGNGINFVNSAEYREVGFPHKWKNSGLNLEIEVD
jgi:hypothetical protein